jgi:hypothetical protein
MGALKKFLIVVLAVVIILTIVLLVLPKNYELEVSADIGANGILVYNVAQNVKAWNAMGMMGGMGQVDLSQIKLPEAQGLPTDKLGSVMKGVSGAMQMKFTVTKTEFPTLIAYKIEGGPMDGVEPQVSIAKVNDAATKVTIKESFEYKGFLGGAKAFLAKRASKLNHEKSLEILKRMCGGK